FVVTDQAPPAPATLPLHDALPICPRGVPPARLSLASIGDEWHPPATWMRDGLRTLGSTRDHSPRPSGRRATPVSLFARERRRRRSEEHTSELQSRENLVCRLLLEK